MAAPLNAKQQRFCEEYLIDLNATQAAVRAGYSKKTAKEIGCENLTKPNIQEYVQRLIKERKDRTEVTADQVVRELAFMGFANMLDYMTITDDGSAYVDLSTLTREQAAAIQEVTVDSYIDHTTFDEEGEKQAVKKIKFKLADKRGALTKLGEHLGMFNQPLKFEGSLGVDEETREWLNNR